jgi:hypothetical protein
MPSHGAMKELAATEPPKKKLPPKELEHIRLTPAENGGVSAEHHFTHYEHRPETHVFAAGQHAELLEHLKKHLGMEMPGRAKGTVASPAEGEAHEEEEE